MPPPNDRELLALRHLATSHGMWLHLHLEEEYRTGWVIDRGEILVSTEALLTEALVRYGYTPIMRGKVYAVHTSYEGAFNDGLYDNETDTWRIDGVPPYALLQIYIQH